MKIFFTFGLMLMLLSCIHAQDSSFTITLWENGAPGFESRKSEPEQAKDWWVRNIHNPSITVFKPKKEMANGTAVIICPGGGFRNLVYNAEGVDAAKYLNSLGITAFVLKYRLFREDGSPYTDENSKQDIFRAMRLVKSLASEFNIDTSRTGVMGFSAGGEEAGWLAYHYTDKHFSHADKVDEINARPAFQVLVYPGPLVVPDSVIATAPPTFLVAANDDACCSEPVIRLLQMHRQSKVPVEVHLYARGDHAFNMGKRTNLTSIRNWPQRLTEWLGDNGWLQPRK